MIDIDSSLRLACRRATGWSPKAAVDLARRMAADPTLVLDWDAGAGESWVRLIVEGRVVAIVSVSLPVVIFEDGANLVRAQHEDAAYIAVPSLDVPVLSASGQVLDDAFGLSARFDVLNMELFSANDLWYVTV
jgi:hypothetical protein